MPMRMRMVRSDRVAECLGLLVDVGKGELTLK